MFVQRGPVSLCGSLEQGRKLKEGGSARWDLEELGASPLRAEAAWGGAAAVTKPSGGLVQRAGRRARAGPQPGRRGAGGQAGRAPGSGAARSGPPRPPPPPGPLGPAQNTSHVCSANPPWARAWGARVGGERCPEGERSVGRAGEWAPGPGKAGAGGCLEG